MKHSTALLAFASIAFASPFPQGVTDEIEPPTSAPDGCSPDASGTFNIQVVNVSSTPSKVKVRDFTSLVGNILTAQRQQDGILSLTLAGGILKDQADRTGYVAANDQFQFDDPPQTGAIYTAGFSVCENNTLALGDKAIWWQCLSGGFYNLYYDKQGDQCNEVYIEVINGGNSASGAASQASDGQPAETGAVSQISDG